MFMPINWTRSLSRSVLLLGALALHAGSALAQSSLASLAEIAVYQGADRAERLIEGAKAEGALTLYTVTPVEDITAITEAFTAKYGIPVTVWRASSEDVLRRAVDETKAGRHDVDVIETNGPELEALHRENILQAITSPVTVDIFPPAVPAHHEWVGSRLNIITAAYNTDLVDAASVPTTWQDLLKPEWKGKLAIEAEAYDWLATVVDSFPSQEEGIAFFTELAKTNGLSLRKGHTLLANMTVSGEVPLALTTYQYKTVQLKADGAPINWLALEPSVARINGLGVSRTATHPNAALLFYEFTLTDAQKILLDRGFTPTNTAIAPLPADLNIKVVNPAAMLDQLAEWRETFKSVFSGH
jgi:iron(III) transport system substrate-binding protein